MRAVFDTNTVVSALLFGKCLAWLRQAWAFGDVTPNVCRETTAELIRVLAYPKFKLTPPDAQKVLEDYLPFAEVVSLQPSGPQAPSVGRDRTDLIFLTLALASGADALVTGDADLTILRQAMHPLRIVTPAEFNGAFAGREAELTGVDQTSPLQLWPVRAFLTAVTRAAAASAPPP